MHLEEEDEEGMIHSLLSSLPNIADDALDEAESVAEDLPVLMKEEEFLNGLDNTVFKEEVLQTTPDEDVDRNLDPILDHIKTESECHEQPVDDQERPLDPDKTSQLNDKVRCANSSPKISEISPKQGEAGSTTDEHILSKVEDPETPVVDPTTITITEDDDQIPPAYSACPKMPKLFLTDLLKHADTLYNTFPPSHPSLSLSSIMGPQSVVFTWSESPSSLPSDSTAEAMVSRPELVVYPFVETDSDQVKSKESPEAEEKTSRKARRKHHMSRKSPFSHMEKKTMVAGTVIVLGVAMAIYGVQASRTGDRNGYSIFHNFAAEGHEHIKNWKRFGGWVGGAVAGVTTKIMNMNGLS